VCSSVFPGLPLSVRIWDPIGCLLLPIRAMYNWAGSESQEISADPRSPYRRIDLPSLCLFRHLLCVVVILHGTLACPLPSSVDAINELGHTKLAQFPEKNPFLPLHSSNWDDHLLQHLRCRSCTYEMPSRFHPVPREESLLNSITSWMRNLAIVAARNKVARCTVPESLRNT
jgi:hypothetical protein